MPFTHTKGSFAALLAVAITASIPSDAHAFGTTPFIEGDIRVGLVDEAYATVKKVDKTNYLVTVYSDTGDEFTIKAEAKVGLVDDGLIKKNLVVVKAKVLKVTGGKGATSLEILSVRKIPKPAAKKS